jgi:hypothetical protein
MVGELLPPSCHTPLDPALRLVSRDDRRLWKPEVIGCSVGIQSKVGRRGGNRPARGTEGVAPMQNALYGEASL